MLQLHHSPCFSSPEEAKQEEEEGKKHTNRWSSHYRIVYVSYVLKKKRRLLAQSERMLNEKKNHGTKCDAWIYIMTAYKMNEEKQHKSEDQRNEKEQKKEAEGESIEFAKKKI